MKSPEEAPRARRNLFFGIIRVLLSAVSRFRAETGLENDGEGIVMTVKTVNTSHGGGCPVSRGDCAASRVSRPFFAAFAMLAACAAYAAPAMPKIIAHRGESHERPENTMAAFRLAFERGVDAVECDVQVTSDNVPVIIHDSTTKRTAGPDFNYKIANTPWDTLKDVKVTAFAAHGTDWSASEWAGETIPLFSDYLDLLNSNGTTVAVVELKANSSALITAVTNAVAAAVAAGTPATKDRLVFISFHPAMVSQIRAALPGYKAWYIRGKAPPTAAGAISALRRCKATGIDVNYSSGGYNPGYIKALADAGFEFAIWTCDDSDAAYAQAAMGVKYITTNRAKSTADALASRIAAAAGRDGADGSQKACGGPARRVPPRAR